MEYEQLAKSYEYGLSKIYEMVINNNPSYAYLLEGNSLVDQKLVMAHVFGHVDFFKNNFCFRSTDLDTGGRTIDPGAQRPKDYDPNRRWIDKMANHGARMRRHIERHGINKVEDFIDQCLSLENLIDPMAPFRRPPHASDPDEEETVAIEVPRLRSKDYMESLHQPRGVPRGADARRSRQRSEKREEVPRAPRARRPQVPARHAPLERWERDVLEIIREEAYYFVPQMQTKIMNEGWASYWHSKLMTEKILDASEIIDYADNNAGVLATSQGRLNPYKLGVELFRYIEERWNKGQFGKEWEECDDLDAKKHWDLRLGLGQAEDLRGARALQRRHLHRRVSHARVLPRPQALQLRVVEPQRALRDRVARVQAGQREAPLPAHELGQPVHLRRGRELREPRRAPPQARAPGGRPARRLRQGDACASLVRVWKRPVSVSTIVEGKPAMIRFDGREHTSRVQKCRAPVDYARDRSGAWIGVRSRCDAGALVRGPLGAAADRAARRGP